VKIYLKLESLQTMNSFKIRGVVAQMKNLPKSVKGCVTMSAGNYGKAIGTEDLLGPSGTD